MAVFHRGKKAKHKHRSKNTQSKQITDDARTDTEEEEIITIAEVVKDTKQPKVTEVVKDTKQLKVTHDVIPFSTYRCKKKHNCFNCNVYKQEDNADYWKENQQFYGVKCYVCKKGFLTKSLKPSRNKPAYICVGNLKGCRVALHHECYNQKAIKNVTGGRTLRSRGT